jgi:hypothetical protein
MKKRVVFLVLSFLGLVFFACEFIIPSAIEIRGTPLIRFADKLDIGKKFTDLLYDAIADNDKMDIFPCKKTPELTNLIYMDLYNEEFDAISKENFPDMELTNNSINIPLDDDKILIDGSNDPIILQLSEIGDLFPGFEFSEYITKLYFSGSRIVDKAGVHIIIEEIEKLEDGTENYTKVADENYKIGYDVRNEKSDYEAWKAKNEYDGTLCPSGGVEIPIPITKNDIAVSFKVFIPEGTVLQPGDLGDGNINVEVVVWLPFVLTADSAGAEIRFPDGALFSSEDDLFGRGAPGEDNMMTDIIQSLSMEILLNANPFKGSELVIWSGDEDNINYIELTNILTKNAFPFIISDTDMEKINDPEKWPFTPNFKMRFSKPTTLRFPQEFNTTEFIFEAKIIYKMDL